MSAHVFTGSGCTCARWFYAGSLGARGALLAFRRHRRYPPAHNWRVLDGSLRICEYQRLAQGARVRRWAVAAYKKPEMSMPRLF